MSERHPFPRFFLQGFYSCSSKQIMHKSLPLWQVLGQFVRHRKGVIDSDVYVAVHSSLAHIQGVCLKDIPFLCIFPGFPVGVGFLFALSSKPIRHKSLPVWQVLDQFLRHRKGVIDSDVYAAVHSSLSHIQGLCLKDIPFVCVFAGFPVGEGFLYLTLRSVQTAALPDLPRSHLSRAYS